MQRRLILELPNDLRCIEEAVDRVVARCTMCEDWARKLRLNFRVSLVEALSNAMIYGNGQDPRKRVRVEVFLLEESLTARVTDEGAGFDPEGIPDPTIPDNICKDGGRGLHLMRELMDEVCYNERGNSVTLTLRLPSPDRIAREASA